MRTVPKLSLNAQTLLCKRYLMKGADFPVCDYCGGRHETPEGLFMRASFDNEDFYNLLASMDFLPNSPTLFNAGREGTLSACFKFDVQDTIESILDVGSKSALVQKWGGGVGYCLSELRPKGAPIRSTHGKACGPVSVMRMYQAIAEMITQGGKREGAQMGVLRCDHPDIEEFIHCKEVEGVLDTFNISVAVTDDFMQAAITGTGRARLLFAEIVRGAWENGDPGVYFIDTAEKSNPTPHLGKLTGTNPCFIAGTKVCTMEELVLDKELYSGRYVKQAVWKAMEEIEVGDYILSLDMDYYNEAGQIKKEWKRVMAVHSTIAGEDLCKICFEHAGLIVATESHPTYVVGVGWRKASELCRGDRCLGYVIDKGFGGDVEYIVESVGPAVSTNLLLERGRTVVYNLEVEDNNNYYAGGVLVHNCGEVPLLDNESCNLGSVNLSHFVSDGAFDWPRLEGVVGMGVRHLDLVIDSNFYPVPEIKEAALRTRKLGLGVMGWADALALMRIPYDSREAVDLAGEVMKFIQNAAHYESKELRSQSSSGGGSRNACVTCIAPTGSISTLADCSSGIEPHYSLEYTQNMGDGTKLKRRLDFGDFIPKIAHEIGYEWHIRHQAAFQKYTDLAVSKTINMPNGATVEDVRGAYVMAWESGCKGVTIYRDGSRVKQALETKIDVTDRAFPKSDYSALVHKFKIGDLTAWLHWGLKEDGQPGEIFITASKQGSMADGLLDAVAILTSIALQSGVPLEEIVDKMRGRRFEPAGLTNNPEIPNASSILDYIARYAQKKFLGTHSNYDSGMVCPECGASVISQSGCLVCAENCGWSKC